MKKQSYKLVLFSAMLLVICLQGCKKLIEIDLPTDRITSESAFSADGTAISFVTNTYTTLGSSSGLDGFLSLSFLTGLSSDELKVLDAQNSDILSSTYKNKLSSMSPPEYWRTIYSMIYSVNVGIEKISESQSLSPQIKQYLLGETKFARAFFYFYLLNLYGDVPLTTTSDWRTNSSISRSSKDEVYLQIIKDLKEAQVLLPDTYKSGDLKTNTIDRVRPTKWSALAMLSRVYLYRGNWDLSESVSTEVINNPLFKLENLNSVFLRNSQEVIWSIQPTESGRNTSEAMKFVLTGTPSTDDYKPFFLNEDLLNAFENNDPRKESWIESISAGNIYSYPSKYKALETNGSAQTEYSVLLRLGEIYLNRAESRARLGKNQDCINDLNTIRRRARGSRGETVLPDYVGSFTQEALVSACLKERRIELFSELGHRWFDLKRTNKIDEVMNLAVIGKKTEWNNNWALYPIPDPELRNNSALVGHQNPGY